MHLIDDVEVKELPSYMTSCEGMSFMSITSLAELYSLRAKLLDQSSLAQRKNVLLIY